jgi:hypothetical protein
MTFVHLHVHTCVHVRVRVHKMYPIPQNIVVSEEL